MRKGRTILVFIVCVAVLAIMPACAEDRRYQEEYDKGMQYLTEGNYSEARIIFGRLSGHYQNNNGKMVDFKDAGDLYYSTFLSEAEAERAEGNLDRALWTLADLITESGRQEYKDLYIQYRNEYCVSEFHKQFGKYSEAALSDFVVKEIRSYTLFGDIHEYPVFSSDEFDTLTNEEKLIAMEIIHDLRISEYSTKVNSLSLYRSVVETPEGLYEYEEEGSPTISRINLNGEKLYDHKLIDSPTRAETSYSGGTQRKKCATCNGTGYVRYYYGSSDLEAILTGHDTFTVGKCPSCKGTGYVNY